MRLQPYEFGKIDQFCVSLCSFDALLLVLEQENLLLTYCCLKRLLDAASFVVNFRAFDIDLLQRAKNTTFSWCSNKVNNQSKKLLWINGVH